jgi:hypothetical protein
MSMFSLSVLLSPQNSHAQNLLSAPESIVFDSLYNRYLLSNYNTGSIVQVDSNGVQSYLVERQNAIQGLEIVGNAVYVGCGYAVKGFDLATGDTTVMNVVVPGVQNINDVTADTSGNLYATDVYGHSIIKVNLSSHAYSIFATSGISFPNGIVFDAENNRLLLCSFRANSPIQAISLEDSSVSIVVNTYISNCDGITQDNEGNYYVSSWATLSIYKFDPTFSDPPEVVYSSGGGAADISCNRRDNILAIPLMWSNSYDLVPLTPTSVPPEDKKTIPIRFDLDQNYPNPFNPSTTIAFQVPGEPGFTQPVNLSIYDIRGRHVKTLIDSELQPGSHEVVWEGHTDRGEVVPSGIYLYTLRSGDRVFTRKMAVRK